MSEHLRLKRIGGIPIGLSLSVVVVVVPLVAMAAPQTLLEAVRGYPDAVYRAVVLLVGSLLFASLLAHELAHALVARRAVSFEGRPVGIVATKKPARLPAAARVPVLVMEYGTRPGIVNAGDTNRRLRRAASTAGSR